MFFKVLESYANTKILTDGKLLCIFIVIDNDIIPWLVRPPEFRTEYCFTEIGKFEYSFAYVVSII